MTFGRLLCALASSGFVSACATSSSPSTNVAPACAAPSRPERQITLYFGRERSGGEVSDTEWAAYVSEVLAPRFPQGFTVWDASGQWRDSLGSVVQERSKVVRLITEDAAATRAAAMAAASEYQRRFRQEAVLRTETDICATVDVR